eukprot:m.106744 g.106744  ORF g.106744 m.106744 type:complete len:293 (+) comp12681_c1_seq2:64-942(+)
MTTQSEPLPNPGSFDGLAAAVRGLFALNMSFKGAMLSIQRPVGNHLVLGHSIGLNGKESYYRFRPNYVGTLNKKSEQEMYPICAAEISHSGDFSANIVHEITEGLKTKLQIQASSTSYEAAIWENEFSGSDFTASLKAINVNPARSTGMWSLSYFQSVTPSLALGSEFQYQHSSQGEGSVIQVGGRYAGDQWVGSLLLNTGLNLNATYVHKISPSIVAGCDFDANLIQGSVRSSVAAQYNFQSSAYRAQITSGGSVAGYFEKQLAPAFNLVLSVVLNHAKKDAYAGIGLNIG